MDLYDIAIARKLAGGSGGGGGSSDFNKAEVTLIPKANYVSFGLYDPCYSEQPWGYHCFFVSNGQIVAGGPAAYDPSGETFTVYFLGDSFSVEPNNAYESSSGEVSWNPDTNTLTITGDCTITGYVTD